MHTYRTYHPIAENPMWKTAYATKNILIAKAKRIKHRHPIGNDGQKKYSLR